MRKSTAFILLLAILAILIAGCQSEDNNTGGETVKTEKQAEAPVAVTLKTEDGVTIKGIMYPNSDSKKGLILLHQFNRNKESWSIWVPALQKTHNVVAIDLRGHGESSGTLSIFAPEDFNNMQLDVKAAQQYLERQGIIPEQTSYIGASIGANTVQNFVSNNQHDKAVLLSPGLTYKGIDLIIQDNSALVIVSKEDAYSYNSVKQLEETSPNSQFIYLENRGHGTDMLDEDLVNQISNFLNE